MSLLLLVLASSISTIVAQSITSVLASNAQLSSLNDQVKNLPHFSAYLDGLTDVTFLAPSNDALTNFFSSATGTAAAEDSTLLEAILSYHVQKGTWFQPANSPGSGTPHFIRTALSSPQYTNVTNGQYVEGLHDITGAGLLYSGFGDTSKIITPVSIWHMLGEAQL
jgi:transforming growth factor-beta-induced protein